MIDRLREALASDDDSAERDEILIDVARKVLAGPSPEAVSAAVAAFSDILGPWAERTGQRLPLYKLRKQTMEAALAAAWATDFGLPDKETTDD